MRDTLLMTIGIDGSRAFIQGRTGTENYSFQLIRNLSLIDLENRYLIYITSSQLSVVSRQTWPENFEFRVIGLPRLWTQVGLAFRTFIDSIDVLFIPSHTLPLIRRPGVKTVITVHDLGAEYLPAFHQLKQVLYLKLMTHYQLKTASKIIAVSEATKKDLIKKVGISGKKIDVVYEGVDKSVFSSQSSAERLMYKNRILMHYGLKKNRYFLFVGTVQPRKNLERLIRAFSAFLTVEDKQSLMLRIRKWKIGVDGGRSKIAGSALYKLVIVGGKGWKSEDIYRLPKELGIEDRVSFLGRVSDEELAALYGGATALTYPSLFEGFGLPIIEAFACSCPVITSNISSMPEIAGKAALLVDPYNIEAIFKAMRLLASNDLFRSSLIKKGILRSKHFDWKDTAEKTLKVLLG